MNKNMKPQFNINKVVKNIPSVVKGERYGYVEFLRSNVTIDNDIYLPTYILCL